MVAVVITNPEQIAYYTQETALRAAEALRNTARDAATIVQLGLQLGQLAVYYNAADDAIDARDDKIDAQIAFMQELENRKFGDDLTMVNCKKDILTDLGLPTVDMCNDVFKMTGPSRQDGLGIERKSEQLMQESCRGTLPEGWEIHDGSLYATRSSSYTSGIINNSEKRRLESFRSNRTALIRNAHLGIKSIFNAGEVLSKYAQAAAIHSGLADLYIQGFNSAGAGLGVTLGQLANNTNSGTNVQPVGQVGVPLDAGTANDVGSLA